MKKCENAGKIVGAIAIAAGAALIGRIIYDFKKIRALTKEEELAGDSEKAEETNVPEVEVAAPVEAETAEAVPAEETAEAPVEATEEAKAE